MKVITILGAGLSATSLINYLLQHSEENDWHIKIGDIDEQLAKRKINGSKRGKAFYFNVSDDNLVEKTVAESDIVVSLLPARFHFVVAQACVNHGVPMLTASYVSKEMLELQDEAIAKGIGIYNELGVDPGIDHMSAMKIIDQIRNTGGTLTAFFSSTGGLVAPAFDDNPWNYKFTWNPRNVVLAGQGVSKFIRNGDYKFIPYTQLFSRIIPTSVEGYGDFEIYPNRDSLAYRKTYNLDNIPTIFRGTIRRPGFAKAWNVFVQLGATDDSYIIENSESMTYRQFINTFLPFRENESVEEKLINLLPHLVDEEVMQKLHFLEIFSNKTIGLPSASPAQILQKILEDKWQLKEGERDMIVMQHRFEFSDSDNKPHIKVASLVVEGESKEITAMAKTVGLPLAIAVKLVATGKVNIPGVSVPVVPELYQPILDELETLGIVFKEEDL
ncbi:MAG: saccharopine dehydrogenase NADP-binding domain-containing protein [Bacteroidales bacterium]|nr:saccharopine dehydrogenase NADP-binding domain-containing protein [Bacteroidales bacterium]